MSKNGKFSEVISEKSFTFFSFTFFCLCNLYLYFVFNAVTFTNLWLKYPNAFLVCCMCLVSMHDEWMSGANNLDHFHIMFWIIHCHFSVCVYMCVFVCLFSHTLSVRHRVILVFIISILLVLFLEYIVLYIVEYSTYIRQCVQYTTRAHSVRYPTMQCIQLDLPFSNFKWSWRNINCIFFDSLFNQDYHELRHLYSKWVRRP